MTAARRAAGNAPQRPLAGPESLVVPERVYQAQIVTLARLKGFSVFHERDSRTNTAGLPDLFLLKPPRALWVEVKREDGRLRSEQISVIAAMRECGLDVRIWRPSSWEEVVATLSEESD